jgi:hypothetical protein
MSKEDANHRMRVSRASDTSSQPRHSRNPPVAAIELADAAECGEGHPGEDARRQCARPSNVFAGVCPGTRSVHTGYTAEQAAIFGSQPNQRPELGLSRATVTACRDKRPGQANATRSHRVGQGFESP